MVLPFLVLYLTSSVGVSPARAGFALTLYGAGGLLVAPFAGRLGDRIGPNRVMVASLLVSGALFLVFPLAKTWEAILPMVVLLAITNEAFRPANMALLTDAVPPEQRRAAFALLRMAINLGMGIGPAIGGFLVTYSFPALFYVDGATSILAGLVLLLRPVRALRKEASAAEPVREAPAGGALRDPRLLFVLLSMLPAVVVFFQFQAALPLYLVRDLGFRESMYGLVFTINTGLIVLLEVRLNLATAHWRHGRSLALGSALFAVGFGALAFARTPAAVAATVVVWTFGEMILLPSLSAYIADICPSDRVGEYMGFYTMAFGVGFLVGPWLGTLLLDHHGSTVLWSAMFVLGLVSTALLATVRDKTAD
jgi:MFS family permease